MLLLVAGLYTVVAVSGLRRVEAAWLEARVVGDAYQRAVTDLRSAHPPLYRLTAGDPFEARLAELTLDYGDRMGTLADEASDVLAVDPRVRKARDAVVRELRSVARDSRAAARRTRAGALLTLAPFPYGTVVEPVLEEARGRWRLDEGDAPEPAPLAAAARPRPTLPLHSEPTGVRLFTYAEGRLLEIDIDGGTVVDRGEGSLFAVVGDRVVLLENAVAEVVEPDGRRRSLGDAQVIQRDADDPATVWLSMSPDGTEAPPTSLVRRVGLDGRVVTRPRTVDGHFTYGAGRWVVTYVDEQDFAVVDIDRPGPRFARPAARPLALQAGLLVWDEHRRPGTVHVRDLARGLDRRIDAPTAGATVGMAAFSPDGRSLALTWGPSPDAGGDTRHRVWLYDAATLTGEPLPLDAGPQTPDLAWSRDGEWLFSTVQEGSQGTIMAWRRGTNVGEPLAIEGQFFTLAAL